MKEPYYVLGTGGGPAMAQMELNLLKVMINECRRSYNVRGKSVRVGLMDNVGLA
jgi:hypothetical protein